MPNDTQTEGTDAEQPRDPVRGWKRIVEIIDAAKPIEVPEIPAQPAAPEQPLRGWQRIVEIFDNRGPIVAPEIPSPPPGERRLTRRHRHAAAATATDAQVGGDRGPGAHLKPDTPPTPADNGGAGGAPPAVPPAEGGDRGDEGDDGLDLRCAFLPHTDLGNAERFRERHRGKLLWSPATGWLAWDGKFWRRDASGRVRAAAHDTARGIQDEAEALRASGRDVQVATLHKGKSDEAPIMMSDALAAFGRASEHSARLAAMAEQAAPYLYVAPEELDADPFKINVANGTLVVRRTTDGSDYVILRQHDPADLMTKCSPVVFDPAAKSPIFDRFLAEVQPDADCRRFLMQWQGLSLTGDVREQKLAMFWGKGKNGKSTFIDICAHIGGDYSKTVPIETFLNDGRGRSAGQASPDLAMLPGVRHLRTSEPERGAKLAEALIKLATGGEAILARHLRKDYFAFYPQFKLTLSGNYRPKISGADDGIWRRVIFMPWPVTVPDDKIDRQLGEKLRAEASGILNRLLDGLRDWLDCGLRLPAEVLDATAEYRRDSDPCGQFLEECVVSAPGKRVRASDMHQVFNAWAKASAAREWTMKGLATALKERGLQSKHSNGMWWLDVDLIKRAGDFVDVDGKALKGDFERADRVENDEVDF
jgi:putative DNA primase/helicase